MSAIIGIPTTRVSDLFIRQRLLAQVQSDQRALARLQTQLSTGRRFELPSEEPIAALRIMSLQRLLERKEQVQSNLATNQSYLTSTDVALGQVSNLVADARATALEVMGTNSTDSQRTAAAQQVSRTIQQLLDMGNQKFRGRLLFAGASTTVRPFEAAGAGLVNYLGDEGYLYSYSDTDLLFETNLTGSEVFGAISEPVRGSADITPVLRFDTRVAELRRGEGISRGSIAVSDGSKIATIDISAAETIGDIAYLIRNNAEGIPLDVEVTPTGLTLQLRSATGNLSVREVGGGTTARELGILKELGVGTSPLVGGDLDPALTRTTLLSDILGTRSFAAIRGANPDNDILLEADTRGSALNGTKIRFVDDPTVSFGNEVRRD